MTGTWSGGSPTHLGCLDPLSPGPHSRSALTLIHGLEQRLLNATFDTNHLFLPSESIQALAFNLNCGFAGLALSSDDLSIKPPSSDYYREQPQQVRGVWEMGDGRASTPEILQGLKV